MLDNFFNLCYTALMYTTVDFPSKKTLKDALAAGQRITVFQPNDYWGKTDAVKTGTHQVTLEGPHYPKPHRWCAEATVVDGIVTRVR